MERSHTEKYTRKRVHTGRVHTERAHTKECTHGRGTNGGHTRRRAHTEYTHPRVHPEKSTHERVYTWGKHTEEYTRGEHTRGEHTWRSIHGGVHTEEFIRKKAHFVIVLLRMALPYVLSPCVLSFISPSSIELQWAKFSDGIFMQLSLCNST